MGRTDCIVACVSLLPLSYTRGIPDGFRSAPAHPLLVPWADHRFVRPDREACKLVMQAKPWVLDDIGNHCDFAVLNADMCHLDCGLSLVAGFDTLMRPQF